MKVFISWSGDYSKEVAQLLNWWIGQVIQQSEPWMSENIDKGAQWLSELNGALTENNFGIVVVTMANRSAPWLLFEAGVLSKALDSERMTPLLCDLQTGDLAGSPLLVRQATRVSEDDMRKLVHSIASRAEKPMTTAKIDDAFDIWWPQFIEGFRNIAAADTDVEAQPEQSEELQIVNAIYDEVLTIRRHVLATPVIPPVHFGGLGGLGGQVVNSWSEAKETSHMRSLLGSLLDNIDEAGGSSPFPTGGSEDQQR